MNRINDGESYKISGATLRRIMAVVSAIENCRSDGFSYTPSQGIRFNPPQSARNRNVASSVIQFCRVQQVGGVSGSDSTTCTFTYDIYALDNTTKINSTGGAVTPRGIRLTDCEYSAAPCAIYGIDNDGTYILYLLNEAPSRAAC